MPQIYVKDYDTTVSFDSGVPMSEIQKALKRQFPPKRTFKDKALSFVTMGHVGGEYGPEEEVSFTPEGKMEGMDGGETDPVAHVPTGDPGFFQDPVTALAMGGFAGVRAAAGPVGKMVTAGREALGWVTGGVSDAPQLAKAGTEALAKGVEAKNLAKLVEKRQAKGTIESITPEAVMKGETAQKVISPASKLAPRVAEESVNVPPAPALETPVPLVQPKARNTTVDFTKDLDALANQENLAAQRGSIQIGKSPEPKTFEAAAPEADRFFKSNEGIKEPSFIQKTKDYSVSMWHKATREYEHLPRNAENAPLVFDLKRLEKQKEVAQDRSYKMIGEITAGLDKHTYDIFRRKVILDDLAQDLEKGGKLPDGLTPEALTAEKQRVDSIVGNNKAIADALTKRKAIWEDLRKTYIEAMDNIGFDVKDRFQNENYFRHQVIDYVDKQGIFGTGKKLKAPTNSGFLKGRSGKSELAINTDYIQPENQVISQMIHDIEVAQTIAKTKAQYDIAPAMREAAKKQGIDDWKRAIPEGYTTWQPREGNVFFMVDTVPAKLARELQEGFLDNLDQVPGSIKKQMAMGGAREEWVVKNEVAETLDNLMRKKAEGVTAGLSRTVMRSWKQWMLISPRRYPKYNIRNMSGDAEAVFIGNPSAFKKTPQAVKEIWDVVAKKKAMSQDFKEWFERGGMSSTLQAQEMNEIKRLWMFRRLYDEKKNIADIPSKVWQKYWNGAKISTDAREAICRYAAYLDYKQQMLKNGGKPLNFGASKPETIMALGSVEDRAYALSNDLLGAYDRVSVLGQSFAEHIFPFWRFQEVNFKRYNQLMRNAANDGNLATTIAKGLGVKTPKAMIGVGKFAIRAMGFTSALFAYNNLMYPDVEKSLPEDVRSKPHLILGVGSDGKPQYFSRLGILGDYLQWFGADAHSKELRKYLDGDQSLKDTALEMAKAWPKEVMNKLVQGSIPITKLAGELIARRSIYPAIEKPGTIRDRGEYAARGFGVENEFKSVTGKPSRGYAKSIPNIFKYESDPFEVAYRNVYDKKRKFLDKGGKGGEGFWLTDRGKALYNMKLSRRYGDKEKEIKYKQEYFKLGGKREGIARAFKNMHPLSGLSKKDQEIFVKTLTQQEKIELKRAIRFYTETLTGKK